MAVNILPFVLLGGGAAYVYTKSQEKKRKRRKEKCPPENTITLGAYQSVTVRAKEKYGQGATPFPEAGYTIDELLPPGCNKNSKDSRVKMQLGTKEKPINFDISVPDLHMLVVGEVLGQRVDSGKLNQKQAQKFWADALTWYKKTTGKEFDVQSLGLEEFAKALAEAMKEALGDLIDDFKEGKGKPKALCPANIRITIDPPKAQAIRDLYEFELARGNKNPFDIADKAFVELAPSDCTKNDYQSLVEVVFAEAPGGPDRRQFNLASFYASLVLDILEELTDRRILTQMEGQLAFDQLKANYKQLTGEDLPPNLI